MQIVTIILFKANRVMKGFTAIRINVRMVIIAEILSDITVEEVQADSGVLYNDSVY